MATNEEARRHWEKTGLTRLFQDVSGEEFRNENNPFLHSGTVEKERVTVVMSPHSVTDVIARLQERKRHDEALIEASQSKPSRSGFFARVKTMLKGTEPAIENPLKPKRK